MNLPNRFLEGRRIAVSVSDSPDLGWLGLTERHLKDALTEIARHLMAAGAQVLFGGDLRQHGFTENLAEVARLHGRAGAPAFINYLPWPVHAGMAEEAISDIRQRLGERALLVFLGPDGRDATERSRDAIPRNAWGAPLTAMRHRVTEESIARVVLGGRVEGFAGAMPGIAEETLTSIHAGQPVFIAGGFGGCARDICAMLDLADGVRRPWPGREQFAGLSAARMGNGLAPEECRRLATTVYSDEIAQLILMGLKRLALGARRDGPTRA